jgi:hypothetical protein
MWVFEHRKDDRIFVVGFYTPDGQWCTESTHNNRDSAARRVNYLNGGTGSRYPFEPED